MKHLGNVCHINGAEVAPVDVITFGSPCQDMSVAGKRAGLEDGERSNRFYDAIRIIKEMRMATNGKYPKYAVWENVPGAFSSNKGHDFHSVLQALCSVCDSTVSVPKPVDPKHPDKLLWAGAGEIVGNGYSLCWRTMDAQYWGVPQRRKRIYLVADFTSGCAREILFKPDSLRGDMQTGNEAGKSASVDAVGSVDGSVGAECIETVTLASSAKNAEIAYNISPCLMARAGTGGNQLPLTAYAVGGTDGSAGVECLNPWDCQSKRILNTIDRHAVCYDARENGDGETTCFTMQRSDEYQECNVASTQSARQYKSATDLVVEKKRKYIIRRLTPTECARLQGFPDNWGELAPYNPADAEFWEDVRKTQAEINGVKYKPVKDLKKWYDKLHNDGAEYKMWGNGIALPNAEFVIHGIAERGAITLGSLFDGSGGFPLAGAINGIEPLWASEVEPYPIAVTKSRFPEGECCHVD